MSDYTRETSHKGMSYQSVTDGFDQNCSYIKAEKNILFFYFAETRFIILRI